MKKNTEQLRQEFEMEIERYRALTLADRAKYFERLSEEGRQRLSEFLHHALPESLREKPKIPLKPLTPEQVERHVLLILSQRQDSPDLHSLTLALDTQLGDDYEKQSLHTKTYNTLQALLSAGKVVRIDRPGRAGWALSPSKPSND